MSFLSDALGLVGSTLSAPGDYTRGLLAGKPGERVGGRDLLRGYGLAGDEDNWGNFLAGMATDVATDPLTYLGSGAGKFVRGLIPAEAASQGLARAGTAASETLAGASKFKEPLRDVASVANLGGDLAGAGRAVSMPLASGDALAGEMSGRTALAMGKGDVTGRLARVNSGLGDAEALLSQARGGYDPAAKTIWQTPLADATTGRHERVHAIIDQASKGVGDASQLPALMRYPAQMKQSANPLIQSLGEVGDELAAQTLQNRGTQQQLTGAAGFLLHPGKNAAYAGDFAKMGLDPRVVAAYRMLPQVPLAAGAGAGAGSGALGRALYGE